MRFLVRKVNAQTLTATRRVQIGTVDLDFASIGQSYFLRYWNEEPETGRHMIQSWHTYGLPQMSAGYFVNNVAEAVAKTARPTKACVILQINPLSSIEIKVIILTWPST